MRPPVFPAVRRSRAETGGVAEVVRHGATTRAGCGADVTSVSLDPAVEVSERGGKRKA
jgi:hypothetical protein